MRILRVVLMVVAAGVAAASVYAAEVTWSGAWEMRYGQQLDQKPEWTAKGYTPRWKMQWQDREAPVVAWSDTKDGDCRGWLLLARPIRIPDAKPAQISVDLDYKTYCALDAPQARSGNLYAVMVPRAAWDALARTPETAQTLNLRAVGGEAVTVSIKGHGPDVLEWASAPSVALTLPGSARPGSEWLIGIAWGAWHYNCDEAGAVRNIKLTVVTEEERKMAFWNAFDLDRPGLEALKAAVEKKDNAAAQEALAEYMRKPGRPKVANPPTPNPSSRFMKRADETLAGTYRLAGCPPYTFEGEVVWNADPHNYNQWAIALNRHSEWPLVASAYLKTGDSKYAEFWAKNVRHWVASMPVYIDPNNWIEGPYNQAGRKPLSLDAGIRMGQTWFQSFEVFRTAPEVPDDAIVDFVRSCYEHAVYLMRDENFKSGSNWGAMESNGLYHIGVLLPEFRDAEVWRKTAMDRTYSEMQKQVYEDGAQTELTPGYHGVSLKNFLMVMKLARENDMELPADFVGRIEKMFEYYVRIVRPNLRTPQFNDSGAYNPARYLRDGFELFPERSDFQWLATLRKAGSPPDYTSTVMPWAGWVLMRSGWERDDFWMAFDAGPFGTGHQHEDKLGILLHAFRHDFLTEGGVYAYDTSQWRKYVLSTRAHNTVRIDGQDQHCRAVRSEYRATEPNQYGFRDDAQYTYARDSHTAGYAGEVGRSVVHRRRVLFVKPDWWIVVDDLAASDPKTHKAETQFLMDVDDVEADAGTLRALSSPAGPKKARLAIVPMVTEHVSVRVAKGEEKPEVRGFIPRGFEKLEPAPAVLYEQPFSGSALQVYALVPYEGDTCPLPTVSGEMRDGVLKADLTFADGKTGQLRVTGTELSYMPQDGVGFKATEAGITPVRAGDR